MAPTYSVICGDCLDLLPSIPSGPGTAIITDPPYGISLVTNYRERNRSGLAKCNDFRPIVGDNRPFNPAPFLRFQTVVLFGANYFAQRLPASGAWIVWDKVDGLPSKRDLGFNDNSDCELIWTNVGNTARIIRHRWMGAMKASERTERRVHPTQKPIELMRQIVRHYTKPGDTVIDPFMGSGTTGVAAMLEGRNFIGIEIDSHYCDIARRRIESAQAPLTLEGLPYAD